MLPIPTNLETFGLGEYVTDFKFSSNGKPAYLEFYFPAHIWESFNFDNPEIIMAKIGRYFSNMEIEPDNNNPYKIMNRISNPIATRINTYGYTLRLKA